MEVIVSLFVVMVITIGIYNLVLIFSKINYENKMRVQAMEIANQQMEKITNLPYDDVGVVNGSPGGDIPQIETIVRQGIFTINNYILYKDDPFDGVMGSSTNLDTIGNDYKIATVEVHWQSKYGAKTISVFSKIIPRTRETNAGMGLLELLVNDANGAPIAAADVRVYGVVTATTTIDVTNPTNSEGYLYFPVPAASKIYEITVTKNGYTTDKTYATSTANPNPHKKNLSVILGDKTSESFTIDKISYLTIRTIAQVLPANWQINENAAAGTNQVKPRAAFGEANNLYFVWEKSSSTFSYIIAQKYNQAHAKLWATDIIVGATSTELNPTIATAQNGDSYIIWNDNRSGDEDIYLARLDLNGNVLLADKKINNDATSSEQSYPRLAISENLVTATSVIVWQDKRNGTDFDIFAQSLDSTGNQLWINDLQITNSVDNEYSPVVAIDKNDNFYTSWVNNNGLNQNIYLQKFDLAGNLLWATAVQVTSSTTNENSPALTIDINNDVYIAWTQESTSKNIFIAKYDSSGNKQWEREANLQKPENNQYLPALASYQTSIYCSWTDDRYGDTNIYTQKFDSASAAQWSEDLRLNTNTTSSAQSNSFLLIDNNDNRFGVWQDDRNGDTDIYATQFNDPGAISNIANQPLRIISSKEIGPGVPKYDFSTTTDASGNKNIEIEFDNVGYNVTLIATATTYSILASSPTNPVIIDPDQIISLLLFLQ